MNLPLKALKFATIKHRGQLDDTNKPYIIHPCQVVDILRKVAPNDENLLCAGYLHDTIEDTKTTYEELVGEFGQDVADLVMEVTHEGSKEKKGYYFPRLKTQRGIMLKFADRLSNISRMEAWDEERKAHYLKRSKFWKSEEV